MSGWWIISGVLLACLIPCGVLCLFGGPLMRLVGLETTGIFVSMIMVTLSMAYGRDAFLDLGLTVALLTFGGGLVFVRFFERWL